MRLSTNRSLLCSLIITDDLTQANVAFSDIFSPCRGLFHVETVLLSSTACGHISVCMASICLGILATTLAQEAEFNHM